MDSREFIALQVQADIAHFTGRQADMTNHLAEDLGLHGDDAWELLNELTEKYHIDMNDFVFLDYFYPEGTGFSWSLFSLFLSIVLVGILSMLNPFLIIPAIPLLLYLHRRVEAWENKGVKEVISPTVAHLAEVAYRRKWFKPGQ